MGDRYGVRLALALGLARCPYAVGGLAYVDRVSYLLNNHAIDLQDGVALYRCDAVTVIVMHVDRDDTSLATRKSKKEDKERDQSTHDHRHQVVSVGRRALA